VLSTGDSDAGVARGAGCVNYEMCGGSWWSFWYRFWVIWRCIGRVTALLVKFGIFDFFGDVIFFCDFSGL
jgi:hypothetical protein